jgi:GNAT superfamily N-acetyltransferase
MKPESGGSFCIIRYGGGRQRYGSVPDWRAEWSKGSVHEPPFQGRGLGGELMAHVERLAASLGYYEVRLYTNKLFAENAQL